MLGVYPLARLDPWAARSFRLSFRVAHDPAARTSGFFLRMLRKLKNGEEIMTDTKKIAELNDHLRQRIASTTTPRI